MIRTISFLEAMAKLNLPGLRENLFSSDPWLHVLIKTYQLEIFVKYVEQDQKIKSYIVYTVVRNFLEWKICICSYCDYCDGHVESLEDWQALFDSLRSDYPEYRIAIRNLRDVYPEQISSVKLLSRERFHWLDLSPELRQIWKATHDSFKAAVKQSEKAGVMVRRCEKKELEKFYRLHLKIRKDKYRIFPQPYRFFDMIWEEFMAKGDGVLLGAYSPQKEFIGGNIYLKCGDTFYYKFNTSSLTNLKYRPNNLLFWEGIKYAKALGCLSLDLGSSGYDQKGLILFKDHTGAKSLEIKHLGFEPPGYVFSQKRILKIFSKVFTHPMMPDAMVRWGSSIIYPYLA